MSRGFPSMTALLGLLAIAGYQNRDKIGEMLRGQSTGAGAPDASGQQAHQGGLGGLLSGLSNTGAGGLLAGGINELAKVFQQNGHGQAIGSWISPGPNQELPPNQLEQAIGPDVLATLVQQTGLSREEVLSRLSRELPRAVDQYTPDGRIPTAQEMT
ncbi:YidB family protein [Microvirga rosea]|uniref:YidB family protein n=1 Tax=Microvirga rosea TaxID=2715425 RepID=UPI001D0BB0BF|nr:YidB family protein [Microvirga rosea]MCB8821246.1 YidB family protein [Microvirga rosea]